MINFKFLKEIKQIKGVFKPPKKQFYLGKNRYGTPYFDPWGFDRNIISIYKRMPMVQRRKHIKLFNRYIFYGWPIKAGTVCLGWKVKWDTPRFEWSPMFYFNFFKWQFVIIWKAPGENGDLYWEMVLWYLNYSDKDIKKAEETWSWVNYETEKSTWDKNYLI